MQEVTLSAKTTIHCGVLPLDFDIFVVAARWLLCHGDGQKILGTHLRRDLHEAMLPAASFVTLVVLSSMNVTINAPLALVLRSSTHFCVSEPRDRVYGLLGLLKHLQRTSSLHPSLNPDYNKPIADVYRDATKTSVLERGDLRHIENEGYERQSYTKIEGLPSWVPNWYCSRTGRWELDAPDRLPVTPIAWLAWPGRTGSSWLGTVTADENVLSIRGMILTTITEHSDAVITRRDLATLCQKAIHNFVSRAYALYSTRNRSGSNTYSARLNHALTAGRLDMNVGEFCCMCVPAPTLCKLHLQPERVAAFAGLPATPETMIATRSAIRIADLLAGEHDDVARRHTSKVVQTSAGTTSANTISQTGILGKRKADSDVSSGQFPNKKRRTEEGVPQHLTFVQCLDTSFRARTKDLMDLTSARKHLRKALRFNVNRKIFLSKCGHIGVGPQDLQDGDILAVSEISQWPFVLRRAASVGLDHYTIVGSAYMEGVEEVMASSLEMGTIYLV